MTVNIKPSRARGRVCAPPSKSAAHRALICAALSGGAEVKNIEYSEDISATLDCLEALGATVKRQENSAFVGGLSPHSADECTLDCRESGSTLRFLIPLCMLSGKKINLTGAPRLFERNLQIYEDLAKKNNITFEKTDKGVTVCGKLQSGEYDIAGNISSQFITGLLLALPLLSGDSVINITGAFESAPYVAMTVDTLKHFGILVERSGNSYRIKGEQSFKTADITVEGDYSNAAFLDGFNLLGGDVAVEGLLEDSLQGDRIYCEMYRDLKRGKREFALADCPDLAPVMFALAAVLGGAHFTGTGRLKIKESNRAEAMRQELLKFGINVTVDENEVSVGSGILRTPEHTLCGHNDHRIVMALSLLCSSVGGKIEGAEAVAKSYPDFFKIIKSLGVEVEYEA